MGISGKWHHLRVWYRNLTRSRTSRKPGVDTMARGRSSLLGYCCQTDQVNGEFSNVRSRHGARVWYYEQWLVERFGDGASCLHGLFCRYRLKKSRDWIELLAANLFTLVVISVTGIITFESSTNDLRNSLGTTVVFPMYLPHAVALAITTKYESSLFFANFAGFYVTRIYSAWRGGYLISVTRGGVLLAASFLGASEVSTGAFFLRRFLGGRVQRKFPSIEAMREALQFLLTVFLSSLFFDTLIALVICSSPLISWRDFYRFWGTSWLGVLAGMLTVTPAVLHFMAWRPRPSLLRPRKVFEALGLAIITSALVVIIFITDLQAVIHPLPYLLFPLIILSAFRFNRLGSALVVLIVTYICSWASIRGKGAVYRMAGSPVPVSSPKLILQVELFTSVLGLVGVLLAAAVREKKKLARDLHTMNEELENTVSQRTQELVMANEELKVSQRKAEEASQAKSDFLANMSHEIRTPIHGIMGLTALLLDSKLSDDQRDSLLSVKECANLLLHIINSILDLAKIEAGRVEVEFVPFNVRQLVSSTIHMLATRAEAGQVDLLWEVDSSVPEWMVGDSGKIQQCLLNLAGNAVKFTHKGSVTVQVTADISSGGVSSTPTLEFENQSSALSALEQKTESTAINIFEKPLEWQSRTDEKKSSRKKVGQETVFCVPVLFEVRDTGIGISNEKLQDIFTPFVQADASTSRIYGGTGLGLCIVQRFVELLGGELLAESELGKGSAFKFCIPLGFSNAQKVDSDNMVLKDILGAAGFAELTPGTEGEAPKSDALDVTTSLLDSEGGGKEETALFEPTAEQNVVAGKKLGTSRGYSLSIKSTRPNYRRSQGEIFKRLEGDTSMSWRPLLSVNSLDRLNSVFEHSNKDHKEDLWGDPAELFILRPKSEDFLRSRSRIGSSHIPPRPLDCNIHPALQQPVLVQSAKPPFFAKDTPLKCSVKFQSDNRIIRDQGRDSTLIAENVSHDANTVVPLFSSDIQMQLRTESESRQAETDNIQDSIQNKSAKDVLITDDELQKTNNLHVLLAEDNLINQKVATRQLQKHGHTVTIVGDGVGAVDSVIANHDRFDLVLMDVQMPMMDGLEATRRIRAEEVQRGWKRLPILGLTAHAIQGYENTCLSCGMDGYLGKPFDINQLLRAIDKFLPAFER